MPYDIETESCINIASGLTGPDLAYWPQVRRMILDRIAAFEAGKASAPEWFDRRLKQIDPYLQLRWSVYKGAWVVERYSRRDRAFVEVLEWADHLDNRVIRELEEGDTWRFGSPQEYLRWKRAQGEKRREANKRAADEAVLEAVDSLTKKRAQNFMEVERAFKTGEKVVFHGEGEKAVERMYEGAKKAAARGELPPPASEKPIAAPKPKRGV